MKVIYLGTPEFAVKPLEKIINSDLHEVVAVVCQPDRPVGRKAIVTPPPVKVVAEKYGIPVLQFEKIRNGGAEELKKFNADIMVTCAYGQILSQEIIDLPRYGIVNVHTSLLPRYRGSSPIQSAILNGDKVTGVTIMQTDVGMDTGDIILSQSVTIGDKTAGELTEELIEVGASLLAEALDEIEAGTAVKVKQDESGATKCKMIKDEDALINWLDSAENIYNRIRAFNPSPIAYSTLNGERIKIYRATLSDENGEAGQVLKAYKKGIVVGCGKGAINITSLQPSGKKVMDVAAFLNGKRLNRGEHFGN